MSWFAHSTLQSGLWIDNQGTYDLLLNHDRLTLSSAFLQGGLAVGRHDPRRHRAVARGPATSTGWQHLYDLTNMDYEGPRFGYGADARPVRPRRRSGRLELDQPGRGPVMAEIDLESSHNPWVPLPRMVDPTTLGDGSVFDGMPEDRASSATRPGATRTW